VTSHGEIFMNGFCANFLSSLTMEVGHDLMKLLHARSDAVSVHANDFHWFCVTVYYTYSLHTAVERLLYESAC